MDSKEIAKDLMESRDLEVYLAGTITESKGGFDLPIILTGIYSQALTHIYRSIESGATLEQIKEGIEIYQGKK